MANKYSTFEFQPYVSQYVDPQSVGVNKILRERFDNNRANKDLIDRTLGSMEVLEGDKYLVEGSKQRVRDTLTQYAGAGNWEDSGIVLDELVTSLESDRGLQLAKQSQANRANELKFIREAGIKGVRMLDFGQGKANNHASYTYDGEAGTYVENVYEPMSQTQLDYDAEMASLLKTIKPDSYQRKDGSIWRGISKGKADRTAAELYNSYLASDAGAQDMRRLMELDLPKNIDPAERAEMAKNDIMGRMKALTHQYVYNEMVKAAPTGSSKGRSGYPSAGMKAGMVANKLDASKYQPYELAAKNLNMLKNRKEYGEAGQDVTSRLKYNQNLVTGGMKKAAKALNNTAGFDEYTALRNQFVGEDDAKFYELLNALVVNTNSSLEGFEFGDVLGNVGTMGAAGFVAGAGYGAAGGSVVGPLGTAVGAGAVGVAGAIVGGVSGFFYGLYEEIDESLSNYNNVRDWERSQESSILGLIDSERDELHDQIADLDYMNKALGTNYTEKDAKRLNDLADNMYTFMTQRGGDEMVEYMNDYGMSEEVSEYTFDFSKDGKSLKGIATDALSNLDPMKDLEFHDYTPDGMSVLLDGADGDAGSRDAWNNAEVVGITEGDPLTDISAKIKIKIDGKVIKAGFKEGASGDTFWNGGFGNKFAESLGLGNIAFDERVRRSLSEREEYYGKEATIGDYLDARGQQFMGMNYTEREVRNKMYQEETELVFNSLLDRDGGYSSMVTWDEKTGPLVEVNGILQPLILNGGYNFGIFEQFQKENPNVVGNIRKGIRSSPRSSLF